MKIKKFTKIQFFTLDVIHTYDDRNGYRLNYKEFYTIPSYVQKDVFPNVIENIFFEILLPKRQFRLCITNASIKNFRLHEA